VRRFSANKSKAKQATSRLKLIDKLKPEDVKPSSRQYPWIRFDYDDKDKLHRQACEVDNISFAYRGHGQAADPPLLDRHRGRREGRDHRRERRRQDHPAQAAGGRAAAAEGQHQVGGEGQAPATTRRTTPDFASDVSLTDWIAGYARITAADRRGQLETLIRGTLGRLLFSGDEVKKSVKVISGGEQGRMLFGKLMLSRPNVLLMDEPTNHLDMESIESLNTGLEKFKARWSSSRTTASSSLAGHAHHRDRPSALHRLAARAGGESTRARGDRQQHLRDQHDRRRHAHRG
jgi:ATPase subunit of ABC transporter with duplicated ATPase domains